MAPNRKARRRFAQALARGIGRTWATPKKPDPVTERLNRLEAENRQLKQEVASLNSRHDRVPGVVEDRKDWFILVGGVRADLKAIPPVEWIRTMEELPSFLWQFALDRSTTGGQLTDDTLDKVLELAKRWITVSAVSLEGVELDRLTLPEAEHAVSHISELNGVTAQLRTWFRNRLGLAGAAPYGEALRSPAEPAARRSN